MAVFMQDAPAQYGFEWPGCRSQRHGNPCSHQDNDTCKLFHAHADSCPWATGFYSEVKPQRDSAAQEFYAEPTDLGGGMTAKPLSQGLAEPRMTVLVQRFDVYGDLIVDDDGVLEFGPSTQSKIEENIASLLDFDSEIKSVKVYREVPLSIKVSRTVKLEVGQ